MKENSNVYHKIVSVSSKGVVLENDSGRKFIDFKNCGKQHDGENGDTKRRKCVAARNVMNFEFIFYTVPPTKLVLKKNFFQRIFSGSSFSDFVDLKKTIEKYGYSTFDLS